jgi:hypothetical protein
MKRGAAILALVAMAIVARGDVIELHDGTKIRCKIVLEDGKKIFYKVNGQTKALKVGEISGIIRSKRNPSNPSEKASPRPKTNPKSNPGHNPKEKAPANPGHKDAPAVAENPKAPPEKKPEEGRPPEPKVPRRRIVRTSDIELSKLFESLRTACDSLLSSATEEEKTFYKMRALILKKHINSCGYLAGKLALDELEDMPISTWKEKGLLVGFLADIVSGCRDRDILVYFWEEWMPYNLKRVESANSREFPLSLVKRIISDLQASYDNMYRSIQYSLRPYKYRGAQRYAVDKKTMRMPK